MKTTVEKLSPTRVKLNISVTPEELKPSIDHAYGHIASQINIPGFRKGKVPPQLVDQRSRTSAETSFSLLRLTFAPSSTCRPTTSSP